MRRSGMVTRWLVPALMLGVVLASAPAHAGRPGPDRDPITAEVVVAPHEAAPGDTVMIQLNLANASRESRELSARGRITTGRDRLVEEFDFPPVRLGPGERRSVDHTVTVADDAAFGRYGVGVIVHDAITNEPVAGGRSGFGVGPPSPIRMSLRVQPPRTQPGGGILLHVGLHNVTDAPLVVALGGRVIKDRRMGRREVTLPSRRVQLAPNERMGVMIPFRVPRRALPGVYGVQIVAGQDLRNPFAIRDGRFEVVHAAAAMIDAAVRPDVTTQGGTVALSVRIQSRSRQDLTLRQSGLIRPARGRDPVRRFQGRDLTLRAGETLTSSMRYTVPEDLPPGRYVFEAFLAPADSSRRPIDSSSAEFTVRPAR